jgi:hypothetical protein
MFGIFFLITMGFFFGAWSSDWKIGPARLDIVLLELIDEK